MGLLHVVFRHVLNEVFLIKIILKKIYYSSFIMIIKVFLIYPLL